MEILRQKKTCQFKIAVSEYDQIFLVNETNSWPVTIVNENRWVCDFCNLPEYVRDWLYDIAKKWKYIKQVNSQLSNLIHALNGDAEPDEIDGLVKFIKKYGTKTQIKKMQRILEII